MEQIPKPHVSKITSFVVVKLSVEQEQKQQQQQQPQKQQQSQPQEQPQQQNQPKQNQLLAVPKIADENISTASEESGKVVIKKSASKVFTVVKVDEEHPPESTSVQTSTPTVANNTEDDTLYTRSVSNLTAVNRPLRHDQSYNTIITQDSKTLHGSVSDGTSMITAINVTALPSVSVIVDTPPHSPQPQSQAESEEPSSQPSQLQPTSPAIMSESIISSSTPPSSSNLTPPVIQVQDEDQKIIVFAFI